MTPERIGFLVYPAMQALDLVGPMDAFAAVTLADGVRSVRCSSVCGTDCDGSSRRQHQAP